MSALPQAPERSELVWPVNLRRADGEPPRVYLDLNHWIFLARAVANDPKAPDGYADLLDAAILAVEENRAIFVLSETHYAELARIRDPNQRRAITSVMEQLTHFNALSSRVTVARLEFDAMFARLLSRAPRLHATRLVGRGYLWIFEQAKPFVPRDRSGNDLSAAIRARIGEQGLADLMAEAALELDRAALNGPTDAELPAVRALGYDPQPMLDLSEKRAQQERDQVKRTAKEPRWLRGRLRDLISARELMYEWGEVMQGVLELHQTSIGELSSEKREEMRFFADGMPSSRVAISLKTKYHRNQQHVWTVNDIHDIDALALAVPYCDAVYTDKAAMNSLIASKGVREFGTFIPRRPGELTEWLSNQPAI